MIYLAGAASLAHFVVVAVIVAAWADREVASSAVAGGSGGLAGIELDRGLVEGSELCFAFAGADSSACSSGTAFLLTAWFASHGYLLVSSCTYAHRRSAEVSQIALGVDAGAYSIRSISESLGFEPECKLQLVV